MIKLTVKCLNGTAEVEGTTDAEVWKKAAFWSSLPTTCPVDGTPTVLGFGVRGGYDYWYVESTGPKRYRFNYGKSTEQEGALFPGSYDKAEKRTRYQWTYWDGENEITVWENGKLLAKPEPTTTPYNGNVALGPSPIQVGSIEALRLEFEQLGNKLYPKNWADIKAHNTGRISNGRTTFWKELTIDEIEKLVAGLRTIDKTEKEKA